MTARGSFVSGLPSEARPAALESAPQAGLAALQLMRAQAMAESKLLEPHCRDRWDGSEVIRASEADVVAKAAADATVALVDGIMADNVLLLRCAALLARRQS